MNGIQDNRPEEEEYGRVLAGLAKLAGAVDRMQYPGRAWSARPARRRVLRPMLWAAASVAAAALVLLAVYGPGWLSQPGDRGMPPDSAMKPAVVDRQPAVTQPAEAEQDDLPVKWVIPSNIDLSAAGALDFSISRLPVPTVDQTGGLEFSIARLPVPTVDQAGGLEWNIPSISLPALEERNQNDENENEQQDSDTGGDDGDRGSGRGDGDSGPAGSGQVS